MATVEERLAPAAGKGVTIVPQHPWNPRRVRRAHEWLGLNWMAFTAAAALLGAGVLGAVGGALAPAGWAPVWAAGGAVLGVLGGGGGVFALYLLLLQLHRLDEAEARIEGLLNVRPLTGRRPLDLDGMAADPVLSDVLARAIGRRGPDLVVECGSGWSTVLIASCLRELGRGRVLAFEHHEHFAERTRGLLRAFGCEGRAHVVHAALADRELEGRPWTWYGPEAEGAVDAPIDLLFVDGPPGDVGRHARYPAVPLLRTRMAADCPVILDDGLRADERWVAERWARLLGRAPRMLPRGRGVWLFAADSSWAGSFWSDPAWAEELPAPAD